jgi:hypothetical protein
MQKCHKNLNYQMLFAKIPNYISLLELTKIHIKHLTSQFY